MNTRRMGFHIGDISTLLSGTLWEVMTVGGVNREEGSLSTAEVLDMTEGGTQEWRNIASMNTSNTSNTSNRDITDWDSK